MKVHLKWLQITFAPPHGQGWTKEDEEHRITQGNYRDIINYSFVEIIYAANVSYWNLIKKILA